MPHLKSVNNFFHFKDDNANEKCIDCIRSFVCDRIKRSYDEITCMRIPIDFLQQNCVRSADSPFCVVLHNDQLFTKQAVCHVRSKERRLSHPLHKHVHTMEIIISVRISLIHIITASIAVFYQFATGSCSICCRIARNVSGCGDEQACLAEDTRITAIQYIGIWSPKQ